MEVDLETVRLLLVSSRFRKHHWALLSIRPMTLLKRPSDWPMRFSVAVENIDQCFFEKQFSAPYLILTRRGSWGWNWSSTMSRCCTARRCGSRSRSGRATIVGVTDSRRRQSDGFMCISGERLIEWSVGSLSRELRWRDAVASGDKPVFLCTDRPKSRSILSIPALNRNTSILSCFRFRKNWWCVLLVMSWKQMDTRGRPIEAIPWHAQWTDRWATRLCLMGMKRRIGERKFVHPLTCFTTFVSNGWHLFLVREESIGTIMSRTDHPKDTRWDRLERTKQRMHSVQLPFVIAPLSHQQGVISIGQNVDCYCYVV